jgi:hypothetical protein
LLFAIHGVSDNVALLRIHWVLKRRLIDLTLVLRGAVEIAPH